MVYFCSSARYHPATQEDRAAPGCVLICSPAEIHFPWRNFAVLNRFNVRPVPYDTAQGLKTTTAFRPFCFLLLIAGGLGVYATYRILSIEKYNMLWFSVKNRRF